MEHYLVIIEHQDLPSGRIYGAFAPDVPGCTATGATLEQTIVQMQRSLGAALRALRLSGRQMPVAHSYEEHEREYLSAGESFDNTVVAIVPCAEAEARSVEAATVQMATVRIVSG
jgi:predicted RNase H-like HicB family nuclease